MAGRKTTRRWHGESHTPQIPSEELLTGLQNALENLCTSVQEVIKKGGDTSAFVSETHHDCVADLITSHKNTMKGLSKALTPELQRLHQEIESGGESYPKMSAHRIIRQMEEKLIAPAPELHKLGEKSEVQHTVSELQIGVYIDAVASTFAPLRDLITVTLPADLGVEKAFRAALTAYLFPRDINNPADGLRGQLAFMSHIAKKMMEEPPRAGATGTETDERRDGLEDVLRWCGTATRLLTQIQSTFRGPQALKGGKQ